MPITSLPTELILHIAGYLRLPRPNYLFVSAAMLHNWIYHKGDICSFASTCIYIRSVCSLFLFKGVDLLEEKQRQSFLKNLDNNTLSGQIRNGKSIRFLRLGLHERRSLEMQVSICKIFHHFSSITTLHLHNFPISPANIRFIQPLKGLVTLSLSVEPPEGLASTDYDGLEDSHYQFMDDESFSMPAITTLILADILVGKTTTRLSRIIKALESSLRTLAVEGKIVPRLLADNDFIGRLSLVNPSYIKLANLTHISLHHIQFDARSLRIFIQNCPRLESIDVDCSRTLGLLPLFYVLGLIRNVCEPKCKRQETDLVNYEQWQDDVLHRLDTRVQYEGEDTGLISCFKFILSPTSTGSDSTKVVKNCVLVLAYGYEVEYFDFYRAYGNDLAETFSMSLPKLIKVLLSDGNILLWSSLESISLGMSIHLLLETSEDEEIEAFEMLQKRIPSLKRILISWLRHEDEGESESEHGLVDPDAMDVDEVRIDVPRLDEGVDESGGGHGYYDSDMMDIDSE